MKERPKTTRRQFLQGRAAADALAALHDPSAPSAESAPTATARRDPTYLLHVSRRAMACEFAIFLNAGQHQESAERAVEALDLVDQMEDQLSVYRPHSEISQINRWAAERPVPVEPRLFALLKLAVDLHQQTGGAFDITAGPLSKTWGFYRREGRMPTEADLHDAMTRVGSRWLKLDDEQRTIQFRRPGVDINLGGIGKGYALDRCVELLSRHAVDDFLLHGGQSSITARGRRAGGAGERAGWPVGVRHPLRPERRLAEVYLTDRAMGTSGSGTQSFHFQGRRYGHILDPRTGQPAEGVLSSTVIAPTAAEADALATAFYVLGAEQSLELCRRNEQLAAILVTPGPRRGSVEVHSAGLNDDDWQLAADI